MITTSFSIKQITNTEDVDYIKTLSIYNETTPIDIKTNSNEITYWINHNNSYFNIYIFSLLINKKCVGFAMVSYLPAMKILIFDYIALCDEYRNNTVFLSFFTLIKMFLLNQNIDIDYYVVEISNKGAGQDVDKESIMFLKFLCMEEFVKIDYEYTSLPLGINNKESSFGAYLYLKTADQKKTINTSTFVSIMNALYYDYYAAWYQPFCTEDEFTQYSQYIELALNSLKLNLNGVEEINLLHQSCQVFPKDIKKDSILPLITDKKRKMLYFVILPLLFALPIFIVWIYNYILARIGISINSVNSLLGGVLGALVTSVITFFLSRKKL